MTTLFLLLLLLLCLLNLLKSDKFKNQISKCTHCLAYSQIEWLAHIYTYLGTQSCPSQYTAAQKDELCSYKGNSYGTT